MSDRANRSGSLRNSKRAKSPAGVQSAEQRMKERGKLLKEIDRLRESNNERLTRRLDTTDDDLETSSSTSTITPSVDRSSTRSGSEALSSLGEHPDPGADSQPYTVPESKPHVRYRRAMHRDSAMASAQVGQKSMSTTESINRYKAAFHGSPPQGELTHSQLMDIPATPSAQLIGSDHTNRTDPNLNDHQAVQTGLAKTIIASLIPRFMTSGPVIVAFLTVLYYTGILSVPIAHSGPYHGSSNSFSSGNSESLHRRMCTSPYIPLKSFLLDCTLYMPEGEAAQAVNLQLQTPDDTDYDAGTVNDSKPIFGFMHRAGEFDQCVKDLQDACTSIQEVIAPLARYDTNKATEIADKLHRFSIHTKPTIMRLGRLKDRSRAFVLNIRKAVSEAHTAIKRIGREEQRAWLPRKFTAWLWTVPVSRWIVGPPAAQRRYKVLRDLYFGLSTRTTRTQLLTETVLGDLMNLIDIIDSLRVLFYDELEELNVRLLELESMKLNENFRFIRDFMSPVPLRELVAAAERLDGELTRAGVSIQHVQSVLAEASKFLTEINESFNEVHRNLFGVLTRTDDFGWNQTSVMLGMELVRDSIPNYDKYLYVRLDRPPADEDDDGAY